MNALLFGILGASLAASYAVAGNAKLSSSEIDNVRSAMIPNGDLKTVKSILEPKGDISSESYLLDYATNWSGCFDDIVEYLLQKGIKPSPAQLGNALSLGCYEMAGKIGPMLSSKDIDTASSEFEKKLTPPDCCKGVRYGGEDGSEQCATQSTNADKTKPIENNKQAGAKLLSIVDGLCKKSADYCTIGDRLRSSRVKYDQAVNSVNACNMEILAKAQSDRDAAEKAKDEFWKQQREEIERQEKAQQAAYEANPKNIEAEGCSWSSRLRMIEDTIAYDKKITEESGVIALKARRQGAMLRDYTQKGLNSVKAKYRQKFGKELNLKDCK